MKRIITLVLLVAAMTVSAQAQGIKFGLKGGLDIVNLSFDKNVFDTSNKLGWFIGPSLKVSLPVPGLGVDIAALYDQKKSEVNNETITQKSIIVPVNALCACRNFRETPGGRPLLGTGSCLQAVRYK